MTPKKKTKETFQKMGYMLKGELLRRPITLLDKAKRKKRWGFTTYSRHHWKNIITSGAQS